MSYQKFCIYINYIINICIIWIKHTFFVLCMYFPPFQAFKLFFYKNLHMQRRFTTKFLILFIFLAFNTVIAQDINSIIADYLSEQHQQLQVRASDIADFSIHSEQFSRQSGLTHVYIRQKCQGIDLFNGLANLSINYGQVQFVGNNLVADIYSKANTNQAALNAQQALSAALQYLQISPPSSYSLQTLTQHRFIIDKSSFSQEDIPLELVYFATEDGRLRLAWDLSILPIDGQHWWSLRIDASDGSVLEQDDWMVQCKFSDCKQASHRQKRSILVNKSKTSLSNASMAPAADQYNVFALPLESPNHGNRSLVTGPFDPLASPFGWHDIDGVAGAEFSNTIGNNVLAQEDANGNNGNGLRVDGGASLLFNPPLNLNQNPANYQDASIVNLFYMNNIMHDIWYQYGFDEANGNFQENNYGRGGTASDRVNADAQDGSGLNNANFGTPPDGGNPRMQMFLWSAPAASNLMTVNSPNALSGAYQAALSTFGPAVPNTPISSDLALADDNNPDDQDACQALVNAAALNGRIVVIRRGACSFVSKVAAAEAAGALAVIMVNNVGGAPITMGGADPGIGIPSLMVSQADGEALITELLASNTINATLVDPGGPFQLDGDFDNGIIAHEYGHGISNRLAGGRNNSGCLNNAEQMGEGWSDWFGLMLTIEPGDQGADPRGIGTYAIGEPTSGNGIRPLPYSTNTAVNNVTYAITNNTGAISQPHGIGFVWCTMLWDLSWAFIETYGYNNDLYNGNGGNNMIMELVIEALKLQACDPGFVEGRDALLAADLALNAGVNHCLIWNVFAARGVGFSADQGSRNSRSDQVEAFDMPPLITSPLINCISSISAQLPLDMLAFEATAIHNTKVALNWTVANEFNNQYFEVQRSVDGQHFESIQRIYSLGDFADTRNYNFVDESPLAGRSYYRLKMISTQDISSYSHLQSVKIKPGQSIQVFPNPSDQQLFVVINSSRSSKISVCFYNSTGTKISHSIVPTNIGLNNLEFDVASFPSGTYMLVINDTQGNFNYSKRISIH